MNRLTFSLLLMALVWQTACTSTSSVVVRDIDAVEQKVPTISEPQKQTPVYQERATPTLPIVERLFSQADAALKAAQWQQAIATAEKGLRIERKDPRFYWVLASAYLELADKKQSQDFARQGLRYADKNSPLARQLSDYLR